MAFSSCGAPLFRPESERFKSDALVLEAVRPHLEDWAGEPAENSAAERKSFLFGVSIEVSYRLSEARVPVRYVKIYLEIWGDWSRGYLYVYSEDDLY